MEDRHLLSFLTFQNLCSELEVRVTLYKPWSSSASSWREPQCFSLSSLGRCSNPLTYIIVFFCTSPMEKSFLRQGDYTYAQHCQFGCITIIVNN